MPVAVSASVGLVDSKTASGGAELEGKTAEDQLEHAVVDNFLTVCDGSAGSGSNLSRLFHTSSDTVNQLLRGLTVKRQDKSIQKLSEETADVLPSFAKALAVGTTATEASDEPGPSSADATVTALSSVMEVDKEGGLVELDGASRLSFLNDNSLSDAFLESMFKRPDIFDPEDFPEGVLSRPAGDVPKTLDPGLCPDPGLGPSQMEDLPLSASAVSLLVCL